MRSSKQELEEQTDETIVKQWLKDSPENLLTLMLFQTLLLQIIH